MKPTRAKKPKTPLLPIDIPLPECEPLEGGAMFVVLRTLDELESFWQANRERFQYAAEGILQRDSQEYLNECEWVFGPSKAAVVKAVFRWDQMGIKCEWYDWAGDDPKDHASWFSDRDVHREMQKSRNAWSEVDEAAYQGNCSGRRFSGNYQPNRYIAILGHVLPRIQISQHTDISKYYFYAEVGRTCFHGLIYRYFRYLSRPE